jgi:hypothetical protein
MDAFLGTLYRPSLKLVAESFPFAEQKAVDSLIGIHLLEHVLLSNVVCD